MKRFKYPALVIKEAKNLKKFARKEELNNLNEHDFMPKSSYKCIYGLLTGDCKSSRAIELIESSCSRVYKAGYLNDDDILSNKLNGSPKKSYRGAYWSPIETYIFPEKRKEAAIRLLKYLKGEIKTL